MSLIGPGNPAATALVRLAGKTDGGGFASGSRIGETAAPSRIDSKSAATSRSATPAPATGFGRSGADRRSSMPRTCFRCAIKSRRRDNYEAA
jgi:hypothetical protein